MRPVKSAAVLSIDDRPRRRRVRILTPSRRRMLKAFALTVVLGSLAAAPAWLWYTGLVGQWTAQAAANAVDMTARMGFRVEEIIVTGRDRTKPADILAALRLERGDAILAYDLAAAKARIEALPWITQAAIERRLPGEIRVSITERWPIAIWQRDGQFLLVDSRGTPIGDDVTGLADLPLVVGEDAPAHAAELVAMLTTEPDLMRRVKAAVRVSGRRWNLVMDRLDGGIAIRLPEENPAAAWKRLARLEREQRLLERKITTVDMRLPDRLVVRKETDPVQDKPADKPKKRSLGKDA